MSIIKLLYPGNLSIHTKIRAVSVISAQLTKFSGISYNKITRYELIPEKQNMAGSNAEKLSALKILSVYLIQITGLLRVIREKANPILVQGGFAFIYFIAEGR